MRTESHKNTGMMDQAYLVIPKKLLSHGKYLLSLARI